MLRLFRMSTCRLLLPGFSSSFTGRTALEYTQVFEQGMAVHMWLSSCWYCLHYELNIAACG